MTYELLAPINPWLSVFSWNMPDGSILIAQGSSLMEQGMTILLRLDSGVTEMDALEALEYVRQIRDLSARLTR